MMIDSWHYSRLTLAKQILGLFESGLSTALVFFAPRRMGKTEFLRKDIIPLSENNGWKTFYFSFLGTEISPKLEFIKALEDFAQKTGVFAKTRNLLKKASKVSGEIVGIKAEFELQKTQDNLKKVMTQLATHKKVLLLLDEVQILAQKESNANFVAALRTSLDIAKDTIKVIFTGSSREGLRRMFSESKAPFFHFGQNLPFPEFDRGFTDHLCRAFQNVTQRKLDSDMLWSAFVKMQKIPLFARTLVERLALNPELTVPEARDQLLSEVFDERAFQEIWNNCSALEQLLLRSVACGNVALFSTKTQSQFAKKLGIENLPISSIQSAVRTLLRKGVIGRFSDKTGYFIEDPTFKGWFCDNIGS